MFLITKDNVAGGNEVTRVGLVVSQMPLFGYERVMGFSDEIPNEGDTIAFRLYDDDDELLYEGQLTDDDACDNQMAALRWGESDAGAAYIKVKRDDEWKVEIG